jgi:hypothetical protein
MESKPPCVDACQDIPFADEHHPTCPNYRGGVEAADAVEVAKRAVVVMLDRASIDGLIARLQAAVLTNNAKVMRENVGLCADALSILLSASHKASGGGDVDPEALAGALVAWAHVRQQEAVDDLAAGHPWAPEKIGRTNLLLDASDLIINARP